MMRKRGADQRRKRWQSSSTYISAACSQGRKFPMSLSHHPWGQGQGSQGHSLRLKIRKKLHKLKAHSTARQDGISPKLLQQCEDELAPVLAMIYRKSLNSGATEWRTATVIPIFKKKKKSAAENYRLVSLTCVSCKVLESILKDDIMVHLHNNQLIKKSYQGFMKIKSWSTNLLEFLDKITGATD